MVPSGFYKQGVTPWLLLRFLPAIHYILLPPILPFLLLPSSLLPSLSRQRIHDNVNAKPRIINGQKPFVAKIVVPFAAVILVAVQDADFAVDSDRFEVIVHEVVASAVQFE